jgi:hypothetical protein
MSGKTTVRAEGIVAEPLDDAMDSARRVATRYGLALDEGASTGQSLTFKQGVKLWSWGSTIVMDFESLQSAETRVRISTNETFAITDWGRGKRLARSILDGLAARPT